MRKRRKMRGGSSAAGFCCFFDRYCLTALVPIGAKVLSYIMHAPEEAFSLTVVYIRICGAGFIVIIAYNLIGSIFRGLGNSKTPLLTVAIACVCNIAGILLMVTVFHLGTVGAAIATIF